MEIKKILITGSEGYIGSTLVEKLLAKSFDVVGLDVQYFTKRFENVPHHKVLKTDIRDLKNIKLEGYDAVIHLAALSNDPIGEIDPGLTKEINYEASVNLAKKAKKSGVKKFIFSSSCSIYGTSNNGIVDETSIPVPLTHYAESKLNAENDLRELSSDSFHVHNLRNATVYGYSSNFRDDIVVNNLTASAYTLDSINILSDGTPWRPLIDVRDLADIFIQFIETDKSTKGDPVNIGFTENNLRVKDIVDKIHMLLPSAKINYMNQRPDDKRSYKVEFKKLESLFPEMKQIWNLEKSVLHLLEIFSKNNYSKEIFLKGKFTRLSQIKALINNKKLDDSLYWSNL